MELHRSPTQHPQEKSTNIDHRITAAEVPPLDKNIKLSVLSGRPNPKPEVQLVSQPLRVHYFPFPEKYMPKSTDISSIPDKQLQDSFGAFHSGRCASTGGGDPSNQQHRYGE